MIFLLFMLTDLTIPDKDALAVYKKVVEVQNTQIQALTAELGTVAARENHNKKMTELQTHIEEMKKRMKAEKCTLEFVPEMKWKCDEVKK